MVNFAPMLPLAGLRLVILTFASGFLFPLVAALVSGDIVAAEDHNGTLKTILTRSLDRGQVFAGKALAAITYALFALALMFAVATIGGSLVSGFHSLTSLSGTTATSRPPRTPPSNRIPKA